MGAVVSGQTSVKDPEKKAFEKYLPEDAYIISCHSLHGPKVDTVGQPLVLIQHRAPDEKLELVKRIFDCFRSRLVYLSYEEHDVVTANTQAMTHAAFLAMGMAWKCSGCYPWETDRYPGGVETVKINIMLRILSAKWHVYAGLAILNPSAKLQVTQYAQSTSDLFKLMLAGNASEMTRRIFEARRSVFGWRDDEYPDDPDSNAPPTSSRKPILMSDTLLDQFHLAARKVVPDKTDAVPSRPPNSHLSLLAIDGSLSSFFSTRPGISAVHRILDWIQASSSMLDNLTTMG